MIVGSLLGDATLLATTAGYCFRVHHGLRQRSLVDWKYRWLRQFVRTPPRVSGNGIYFRTVTHPALSELRKQFYRGRTKIVPLSLLEREFDHLALAVWIMDDGSAEGGQVRINTQSFTTDEVVGLADILRTKFGIVMRLNVDKAKPRLRCEAASMARLRDIVKAHTISDMFYKLSL